MKKVGMLAVLALGCTTNTEPAMVVSATSMDTGGDASTAIDRSYCETCLEVWHGLVVEPEHRCSPYDSGDYSYPQSVENLIIDALGGMYGPYTGRWFDNKGQTDIEHMVARSEAHDSGLCRADPDARRRFARDLLNLTLASPDVNRRQKKAYDVAEWLPPRNKCWFVARTIEVRRKWNLTIDRREAAAADQVLRGCDSTDLIYYQNPAADHPPVQEFRNCKQMRDAGWTKGVSRSGGTYRDAWDDAEIRTYNLNTARDGDKDGRACE